VNSIHLQLYFAHISIVCMACEFLWDFILCSGLVELIVTVQGQHINNRKYSNSYKINDEYIQLSVYVLQSRGNDIPVPHGK